MVIYHIDMVILHIDMGYGLMMWEMTVSIWSSPVSIWDILLLCVQVALPFNAYGTVAMARRDDDVNSGTSQFFFLTKVGRCYFLQYQHPCLKRLWFQHLQLHYDETLYTPLSISTCAATPRSRQGKRRRRVCRVPVQPSFVLVKCHRVM
jgi:hypothetical protein